MMAGVYVAAELPSRDARQFLSRDDLDGMGVLTLISPFMTMTRDGWEMLN